MQIVKTMNASLYTSSATDQLQSEDGKEVLFYRFENLGADHNEDATRCKLHTSTLFAENGAHVRPHAPV